MKIIAIIANIVLFSVSIFLAIDEMDGIDLETFILISVFLVTPVISIIALILSSSNRLKEGWISLWFKRKALEEKKKIEELSSKQKELQ